MHYWLAITFCVAMAQGREACDLRVVPEPFPSPQTCMMVGHALVHSAMGYRPPFSCTNTRPDLPEAPAPVQAGRWAGN